MITILLQILLLIPPASAARRAKNQLPTMVVNSVGSADFLKARYPNQKIEVANQRSVAAEEAVDGYVPPTERGKLFEKVGLTAALAKYDDLDQDILVMAVRDADQDEMNRLLRGYPNLKLEQLVRLKAELGAKP